MAGLWVYFKDNANIISDRLDIQCEEKGVKDDWSFGPEQLEE